MNVRARPSNPGEPARKVLVVEDDPSISLGLRINLEAEGYAVTMSEDGEGALERVHADPPDLIILDVMLPSRNGLEVLQALRADGHHMPIIILSAKSGEIDKVTGLELGAEDYVAKPFSLAELLARVRAALRRASRTTSVPSSVAAPTPPVPPVAPSAEPAPSAPLAPSALFAPSAPKLLAFGDVVIDVDARTVCRKGGSVEMTATEFDVLMCFVEAKGRALSRDVIFQTVWGPNHHGTPRTIDNFVQQLRAKLEEDPQQPRILQTVRGVGYRFSP